MPDLSIVSYNVRGLGNELKRRKIFNYLHEHKHDIIMLQETHSVKEIENIWEAEWGGRIVFAHGTSAARGTAILIKKKLEIKINEISRDPEGRFVSLSFCYESVDVTCTSVYAPNTDGQDFFVNMFTNTESLIGRKIYAGDFNTILDKKLDIKGGRGCSHPKATEYLNEYMSQNDLVDIWRVLNPDLFRSTFIQKQTSVASALMERIDFFLIESSLQQFVDKVDINPAFASDHAIPCLDLNICSQPPGPGYWKFNNQLLDDEVFIQDAVDTITEVLSQKQVDIFEKWELMKFKVKQCALRRSINLARSEKQKLQVLNKKLKDITKERDNLDLNTQGVVLFQDHNLQIEAINNEIDGILTRRTAGAMIRSRANWYELAEKPSKYFMSLEKHRYNRKTINKIYNHQGTKISDPGDILDYLTQHYTKVFASPDQLDPDMEYLALLDIPQVKESDAYWLKAPIQLEEIHLALKSMNLDKCPGTDGLTIEFYKKFWPMIASHVHKLFNTYIERKILNRTAREAVTSLMGKPDKDPLNINSWRPLSLLNNDYKLYAKVLVRRMQHVADYLIHYDQKGFMKNRDIADNLLNLITTVNYCNEHNVDSLLVSIDFSRAFDSCNWKAIWFTLQAFGYPQHFIEMIMPCYNDIKTTVMNNNYWNSWIKLKNGVRQGCPLSGIIFCHLIAVLRLRIVQNDNIKGIDIFQKCKIMDMFADDIWNVIKFEKDSFEELMNEYDDFYYFSGLAINYNKTEIMRMGSIRNSNAKFYSQLPLIWSDGPIKILGILIHNDMQEMIKINYHNMLDKVQNICKMWAGRTLTPVGKIQIINTLVNPIFSYKMRVLQPPSEKFMIQYKRIVTKFIWNDKVSKISFNRLIASYEKGGLQLRDITIVNKAMKLALLDRVFEDKIEKDFVWKQVYQMLFQVNSKYIFDANLCYKDVVTLYPKSIFTEILALWAQEHFHTPTNVNEILQQNLWYNSHVKKHKKPLFVKTMYDFNIKKIIDVYDLDKGSFLTYEDFDAMYPSSVNYLQYHSVISCIPKQWKNVLRINAPSVQSDNESWSQVFERLSKCKLSRSLYAYFRDKQAVDNSTLLILWNNDLRKSVQQKRFNRFFIDLRKLTMSTKLRYFQYRILTRALTLNIHVSKWKHDVSPLCTFCKEKNETTLHFFTECVHALKLWKALKKWLKHWYQIDFEMHKDIIIFCCYRGRDKDLVNTFILVAKFYMYRCRVQNIPIKFTNFIKEVTRVREIEKVIANKYGKQVLYQIKWQE